MKKNNNDCTTLQQPRAVYLANSHHDATLNKLRSRALFVFFGLFAVLYCSRKSDNEYAMSACALCRTNGSPRNRTDGATTVVVTIFSYVFAEEKSRRGWPVRKTETCRVRMPTMLVHRV